MDGGTATVRVEATLERWTNLMFAGDRHVVGWTPGGWIVTSAVTEQVGGVINTYGGKRFRLGERASALEDGAIAAARSMMRAQCMEDDVIQRALDRAAQALLGNALHDAGQPQPQQSRFDFG